MTARGSGVLPEAPSFRLDGRRALVTGASRGIGLGAAAALAAAGAEVLICARSANELEAAAAAIRAANGKVTPLPIDVTDLDGVESALDSVPLVDILINNAGMNRPSHFVDVSRDDYDAVMALNVRSTFFLAQMVARRLIAAERPGSIINMSSQMGLVGGANRSLYCASKWAMEGFTKAMAVDLAPYGIRVNTICPTFIETPMTAPFFKDAAFRQSVLEKIKLGRIGQIEDLTGAIVFLASDAAGLMTGSSLVIDGGWTAD